MGCSASVNRAVAPKNIEETTQPFLKKSSIPKKTKINKLLTPRQKGPPKVSRNSQESYKTIEESKGVDRKSSKGLNLQKRDVRKKELAKMLKRM